MDNPRKFVSPAPPIHYQHAAGIDVGARQIYVGVPPGSDPRPVRSFDTFTEDLLALRDWLIECGVTTVALESTGVYWIPLFQILEAAGIEVVLVNARHCKNLPGRKTDVQDCQWLQYLHSVGLLRASFRPADQVCAVRSILRHRDGLLDGAARCVNHLHKALTQMNIQLQHVISDVTGVTGLAILQAILAGERDPQALARLKDHRIKASREVIAKSLLGDWREEHLFTLRQSFELWKFHQQLIAGCDAQMAAMLAQFDTRAEKRGHAGAWRGRNASACSAWT
jgi:transposase